MSTTSRSPRMLLKTAIHADQSLFLWDFSPIMKETSTSFLGVKHKKRQLKIAFYYLVYLPSHSTLGLVWLQGHIMPHKAIVVLYCLYYHSEGSMSWRASAVALPYPYTHVSNPSSLLYYLWSIKLMSLESAHEQCNMCPPYYVLPSCLAVTESDGTPWGQNWFTLPRIPGN